MHIVDGEHGHCGHDHEHCGHEHTHEHTHEHCGACEHAHGSEQEALLNYMVDHNKAHAAELADVAKKFREAGRDDVAAQIDKAIENYDKGNLYLGLALSMTK